MPAAPAPEPQAETALPIESLLLRFRMITPAQLADAMKEEAVSGKSVATIVVEKGWVTPEAMAQIAPDAPVPAQEVAPEPAPAEPAPAAAPAPVVAPLAVEPPVVEAPAPAPAPEAVPVAHEPVAPPVMPEPVAQQPSPQPEATVAAAPPAPFVSEPEPQPETLIEALAPAVEPAPAPEPEPVVEPEPFVAPIAPQQAADGQLQVVFQVLACLSNGERIEIARVHDAAEAKAAATDAMRSLKTGGDWPMFSGRFVRPESIVSIDVAAHV